VVSSKTNTRVSVYRETHDFALASAEIPERNFLALYQTDLEESLNTKLYTERTQTNSEIIPQTIEKTASGEFDSRIYKLIQDFNPFGRDDSKLNRSFFEHLTPFH
jgi:hypothetical protein